MIITLLFVFVLASLVGVEIISKVPQTLHTPLAPLAVASNPNGGRTAEALYQQGSLRASFIHHYFPSNPEAVAAFFGSHGH